MDDDFSVISDGSFLPIESTPLASSKKEKRRLGGRVCTPKMMRPAKTSTMTPVTILDLTLESDNNDNQDTSITFVKKVVQKSPRTRRRVWIPSPKGRRRSFSSRKRCIKTLTKEKSKKPPAKKPSRWGPPNKIVDVDRPYAFSTDRPLQMNFAGSEAPAIGNIYRFNGNNNAATMSVINSRFRLRPISIDGQNVAVGHGKQTRRMEPFFSSRGIDICVDYFKSRGHNDIKVFLPAFRMKVGQSDDKSILEKLERQGHLILTPSRTIGGKFVTSYDDRYVVQYAASNGGIIVSNDQYRDLLYENVDMRRAIEERLLMFNFAGNLLMFPPDPLGRYGPKLDDFLRFPR